MNLPEQFIFNMQALLNGEYDDYIKSFDCGRVSGLRANTLKLSPEKLFSKLGTELTGILWCNEGFYYNGDEFRPAKHKYYNAGLYYIQEPSAMSPASVMQIEENDRVLDLCAAPGGKSTHIAAKLNGTGLLVSNDISASRCRALIRNLELSGARNAVVLSEQPQNLKKAFAGFFDKILVDAPCSGEGMFRKDSALIQSWSEDSNEKFSHIQKGIMRLMPDILAEGGEIMYSTCTFSKHENEYVIEDFLNNNKDFYVLPIDCAKYGFESGGIPGTARLFPHKQNGEGHFLAYLKRSGESKSGRPPGGAARSSVKIRDLDDFTTSCLNTNFTGKLITHKASVFLQPVDTPELTGLRVARGGFYLGDVRTKRFEPSHALAMGLKMNEFNNVINFDLDDPDASRYLKGESFDADAGEGYALVCVDSYPLGFGKVVSGRLKNKYPSYLACMS